MNRVDILLEIRDILQDMKDELEELRKQQDDTVNIKEPYINDGFK